MATPPSPAGPGGRIARSFRAQRLSHRRHNPFRRQQPDRLHHGPAAARSALSHGCREGRPGADLSRQWRRSRGGGACLAHRHRISPPLQEGRGDRHVLLSPPRPQRSRRAGFHPAADVQGDRAPPDARDLCQAPAPRRACCARRGRAMANRFTAKLEAQFEAAKSYRPNKADWLEGAWTGSKGAGRRSPRRDRRCRETAARDRARRSDGAGRF